MYLKYTPEFTEFVMSDTKDWNFNLSANSSIIAVHTHNTILYSYEIYIEFESNSVYHKNITMLPELFVIVWQLLVTMSVFRYDIHCNTNISIIHEQVEASEKIKCSNISYMWVAWISTWIFIPILLFEWMFMKMIYFSLVLGSLFRSWVMLLYITYMRLLLIHVLIWVFVI